MTTETPTATELRSVADLKPGDVVRHYGMRLRIDREVRIFPRPDLTGGEVYATTGVVLNVDEVRAAGVIPVPWLYDRPGDEPRWTCQGIASVRYVVEVSR